jgi:peptidyl-prolyl cis-trans isomerase B (cyclophilin B)
MKKYLSMVLLLATMIVLTACGTSDSDNQTASVIPTNEVETDLRYADDVTENPIATLIMENGDIMKIELMPKTAPNSVLNFIHLAKQGYYDGLIFHRVIPGFMIQGGDPTGTGSGGPGYTIDGEFTANGVENNLLHERGVISMARSNEYNSAGSQFFIMVENYPSLDNLYAAFGKVIEGIEAADKIVATDRNSSDRPLEEQKIKQITIDTKGFDYPQPNVNVN